MCQSVCDEVRLSGDPCHHTCAFPHLRLVAVATGHPCYCLASRPPPFPHHCCKHTLQPVLQGA
ncbi:hypothetical protein E2C01_068044 [Portunus trituberculatus]|uniref:Uncharacterized protein n=1 Tax=Portunus trituberculatus TaxID=210409 RepID=A0A5B7HVH2_PORTR|nr:hypothetical protein [Portunus trituberculatus]